jgi:hypothetical protein
MTRFFFGQEQGVGEWASKMAGLSQEIKKKCETKRRAWRPYQVTYINQN